jgi:hypothetical protein
VAVFIALYRRVLGLQHGIDEGLELCPELGRRERGWLVGCAPWRALVGLLNLVGGELSVKGSV